MFIVTDYSAVATQPICGYTGPCRLHITGTAIIVHQSQGEELATWLYNTIRQFNTVDSTFSFTSGRRGPFGVGDYSFELPQKKVSEIQKKISGYTGAVFAHNRAHNNSTLTSSMSVGCIPKKSGDDILRTCSESETVPSPSVSSNLYPQTNPSKAETYQNTGIGRTAAPPLPSRQPVNTISPQSNASLLSASPAAKMEAYYVNSIRGSPRPLPRKTKPSSNNTSTTEDISDTGNAQVHRDLGDGNDIHPSPTSLPKYAAVKKTKPATSNPGLIINPVGAQSDLGQDPVEYGDISPEGPNSVPKLFSPPIGNSGYSDIDYDVIRRNREMGKFLDPDGVYSEVKNKSFDTYNGPLSQARGKTCNASRTNEKKFEDIPGVYADAEKLSPSSDLYNVPRSSKSVSPDLYDVPPPRKVSNNAPQTYHSPLPLDLTYDIPLKHTQVFPVRQLSHSPGASSTDLYDVPQSKQPVGGHETYDVPQSNQPAGGHETYDVPQSNQPVGEHEMYNVVPSRSPQLLLAVPVAGTKLGYENIGPKGEILGEVVAKQLRQELLKSLGIQPANLRPLQDTKKQKLSRSCDFLNDVGQEKTSPNYKGLVLADSPILNGGTLPPSSWHNHKMYRRLSGSLGDIPVIECDDNDAYVVLNKVTFDKNPSTIIPKPPISAPKPPIPAPKPRQNQKLAEAVGRAVDDLVDDFESNDVYIAMNRTSLSESTHVAVASTMPLGYVKMNTVQDTVKKSSSFDLGLKKESSPISNRDKRNSDLVWPANSQWSLTGEPQRKNSNESEVFTPSGTTSPTTTDEHPIVVAKPSAKSKRSILLKGVGAQRSPEKRSGMHCFILCII